MNITSWRATIQIALAAIFLGVALHSWLYGIGLYFAIIALAPGRPE